MAPLLVFPSNTEPDSFDVTELVRNCSYGAEFDLEWLLDGKLYDKYCEVFKVSMVWSSGVSSDWFDHSETAFNWLCVVLLDFVPVPFNWSDMILVGALIKEEFLAGVVLLGDWLELVVLVSQINLLASIFFDDFLAKDVLLVDWLVGVDLPDDWLGAITVVIDGSFCDLSSFVTVVD